MSGINTRSTLPVLVSKKIIKDFLSTYDQWPSLINRVFDVVNSGGSFEFYQELGGFKKHQEKGEGVVSAQDTMVQGPETKINNIAYALSYEISHELIADNSYGKILSNVTSLAESAAETREILAFNVLNKGFVDLIADGQTLFSTAHPLLKPGSNGEITNANRPVVGSSLSEASLTIDIDNIAAFLEPGGLKQMAKAMTLVNPQSLDVTATKLLNSELEVNSSNNAINVFARNRGMLPGNHVTSQFLTDQDTYFLRTNIKGLTFQERETRRVMMDNLNRQMVQEVVSYFRVGQGVDNHRSIYANPGS